MTHQFDPGAEGAYVEGGGLGAKQKAGVVVAIIVGLALLIFVFSNTDSTSVSWLGFEATLPLWSALLGSAVAGVLLWPLIRGVVRSARGIDGKAGSPGDGPAPGGSAAG